MHLTALDAGNGLSLAKAEAVQVARYQVRVLTFLPALLRACMQATLQDLGGHHCSRTDSCMVHAGGAAIQQAL